MTTTTTPTHNMEYVRLGNSGLKISKIVLGCMSYGSREWEGWVLEEEEALTHIKRAYELGINAFDTANVYSNGLSETILGKAIKKYNLPRDEIVVMTKVFFRVGREPGVPFSADIAGQRYTNQLGLSRKHIFESVKHSLDRLQLDYVDVLQCHRFDPETPIEETMQALHDVVKAGYARYIGMSSCYAWQFQTMQNYAITHGLTPFISMQNHHNAVYREEEREMMPTLQDFGVGCIPWSPLARGFLAKPVGTITNRVQTDAWLKVFGDGGIESSFEINKRVEELAKKKNVSMAQITVAWSLAKDFVSAPIVGSTSLQNLEDIIGGIHVKLTPEEVKYIDEPYLPRGIIGH